MQPTPEQQAFESAVASGDNNIMLISVAGSGKTTEITRGAELVSASQLFVAFNKTIKKTLGERVGHKGKVYTVNGLGLLSWRNALGYFPETNPDKLKRIVVEEMEIPYRVFPDLIQLVSKAKANGLVPNGAPGAPTRPVKDTEEEWRELIDHYDIDTGSLEIDEAADLARKVLLRSINLAFTGDIDFDDQIYMPVIYNSRAPKFHTVWVDEAQDISAIQRRLINKAVGNRIIAVGDPYQSIYGFRGADHRSIELFKGSFEMNEMRLSVSFRCPKAVVRVAQDMCPYIQPADWAQEGTVETLPEFDAATFQNGDVILCRNNAPVVGLAFQLIAAGVPAVIAGRDLDRGLINLIGKFRVGTVGQLIDSVEDWAGRETAKLLKKGMKRKAGNLIDKVGCITAVAKRMSPSAPVGRLVSEIRSIFSRKNGRVLLSTIHKAKGLEWRRVFFLNEYLIPSKYAEQQWEIQQESNLRYVAVTRALESLYYIDGSTWSS